MTVILKEQDQQQIKQASKIALMSILNLTFLPAIAFVWLLMQLKLSTKQSFAHYHLQYAIKLNLIAAAALILVTLLMIVFGGFNSGWTWVFVITYFMSVHTFFIVIAVWALIRSWSGHKITSKQRSLF